tara:strand:+ start:36 stop:1430 length:1395 start_codon:yes stop_codon:yes gene_type:complete
MSLLDRLKSKDLSSFDYTKIETSRREPSNVKNLPTPPARTTEVTTTVVSSNFSKLANADRGSNDVKQPSDIYLSAHRFNDGFGNVALQVIKTAEDLERWAKWTITPKGIIFNIKQTILQRFNARKETRIYNPLGFFTSLPPYFHAPRHARSLRTALTDLVNPPKYNPESEVTNNTDVTPEASGLGESITNLFKNLGGGDETAKDYGFSSGPIRTFNGNLYDVTVHNALQVPYGGQSARTGTKKLPKDFIKFRIRDLVNGKWLIFPAHLENITDTVSPQFNTERYIGRPDAVHVYTGTERTVSLDFKVAAFTKQEIPIIQEKMNYLVGLGYPSFKKLFQGDESTRPVAPYVSITVGDMFNDTPGYFDSITITVDDSSNWETDDGFQIPMHFAVTAEFTHIGKYSQQTLGKHYDVPFLPELHDVKSGISPYLDQTKKTSTAAYKKKYPFHAQMNAKVGQNSIEKSE